MHATATGMKAHRGMLSCSRHETKKDLVLMIAGRCNQWILESGKISKFDHGQPLIAKHWSFYWPYTNISNYGLSINLPSPKNSRISTQTFGNRRDNRTWGFKDIINTSGATMTIIDILRVILLGFVTHFVIKSSYVYGMTNSVGLYLSISSRIFFPFCFSFQPTAILKYNYSPYCYTWY